MKFSGSPVTSQNVSGRGSSQCQGPETGAYLVGLWNHKKPRAAGAERARTKGRTRDCGRDRDWAGKPS